MCCTTRSSCWPGAERRILGDDDPFAARVGLAARDLLAAVSRTILAPGVGAAGDDGAAVRPDAGDVEGGHGHGGRRGATALPARLAVPAQALGLAR